MAQSFDLDGFSAWRREMNQKIAEKKHLGINRFFNLDTKAYEDGALDARTKELLGLCASMVLRCNDCIDYHLVRCVALGAGDDVLMETFNVALVVGGSIVIPHLRHAVATLEALRGAQAEGRPIGL